MSQRDDPLGKSVTHHLEPGYVYAGRKASVIRTVVGSCVAVCLWDPVSRCGGMNHFLYPHISDPAAATPQYGNAAIVALLAMMKEIGCFSQDLLAQIYGGARMMEGTTNCVGEQNIKIARVMLARKKIPVITEDVGGMMGRKLLFDTDSGHTAVLKVHRLRQDDWIESVPGNSHDD
ncbi:MAG: hypothetical protein GF398_10215 [Chitinivibrionales bacterium]|nr:hypothetical protein [Chitinivibrionales bacterium]